MYMFLYLIAHMDITDHRIPVSYTTGISPGTDRQEADVCLGLGQSARTHHKVGIIDLGQGRVFGMLYSVCQIIMQVLTLLLIL